jgi:cell division protein ZapE
LELNAGTDYRLRLFEQAGTYLTPANESSEVRLGHYFAEFASGQAVSDQHIVVLGRTIRTRHCAKGIAWFHFIDICDGPRSQEDYIEIARCYPTVIISDIPVLTAELDNPARRFIALVDEFYDRKVKLILSAMSAADAIYQGTRLEFDFRRTSSRLIEMQSADYLHAPHLA